MAHGTTKSCGLKHHFPQSNWAHPCLSTFLGTSLNSWPPRFDEYHAVRVTKYKCHCEFVKVLLTQWFVNRDFHQPLVPVESSRMGWREHFRLQLPTLEGQNPWIRKTMDLDMSWRCAPQVVESQYEDDQAKGWSSHRTFVSWGVYTMLGGWNSRMTLMIDT